MDNIKIPDASYIILMAFKSLLCNIIILVKAVIAIIKGKVTGILLLA
jgi:hypothetical protein